MKKETFRDLTTFGVGKYRLRNGWPAHVCVVIEGDTFALKGIVSTTETIKEGFEDPEGHLDDHNDRAIVMTWRTNGKYTDDDRENSFDLMPPGYDQVIVLYRPHGYGQVFSLAHPAEVMPEALKKLREAEAEIIAIKNVTVFPGEGL